MSWHRGLPARLFAAIVVVAAFAVAATAYLAVHTTRDVIEQEQGRAVASNREVYSTLIGYAATHRTWNGAESVADALARRTGLRITLAAPGLRVDTGTGAKPPTDQGTTLDPLDVDPALDTDADAQNIDRAAVGPFRLPAALRPQLQALVSKADNCLSTLGVATRRVTAASGRPYLTVRDLPRNALATCPVDPLTVPVAAEDAALSQLEPLFQQCLPVDARGRFKITYDVSPVAAPTLAVLGSPGHWTVDGSIPAPAGDCLLLARQRQLAGYVAPSARLYLTDESGTQVDATSVPHVSPSRVALAGAIVVALAALVAAAGALRLNRSLRAVTHAAQRMRGGDTTARVPLTARRARRRADDLTQLATTFNEMAAAVEDGERRQKEMVADISHELRSPLTTIIGWVEAVQDGVVEPDPATLETIAGQARQLEHVIDDLRDLALAEAGHLNLRPAALGVADLLEQLRAAFAVWAQDAGVGLTTDAAENLVVRADPARLTQCLGNLVSNALAYTPEGGQVHVAARREDGVVVIDVTDDGIGISAADLPHVFERLWRAERSRSRRAGGSGLGLPIARRIARAHGGDITVTSENGRGSTFTILLPTDPTLT